MISVFFFNDTATTEIYTLSLHDALPICREGVPTARNMASAARMAAADSLAKDNRPAATLLATSRSEEHTSELQSHLNLVCRLLLEKKKKRANLMALKPTLHPI